MNLSEIGLKSKDKIRTFFSSELALFLVFLLAITASFAIGYLAGRDGESKGGVEFLRASEVSNGDFLYNHALANEYPGLFVASRNGTKYYLPWCSGVNRIKDSNKVWFDTEAEAVNRGYSAASNCRGI